MIEVNCKICGKLFLVKPYRVRAGCRFCSLKCHFIYRKTLTGTLHKQWKRKKVECKTCKKTFFAKASQLERGFGNFCRKDCYYVYRRTLVGRLSKNWREKVSVKCLNCNKINDCHASIAKNKKFCSHRCKGVFLCKNMRTKNTLIEIKIRKVLLWLRNRVGLEFEEQKKLCNITVADFFLPETKTAVYCDGDYWHSRPERILRDRRQEKVLTDNGYRFIRMKEKDINKNPKIAFGLAMRNI